MSIYKLKMVILGDSGVGKSCLIGRYVYDHFNDYMSATIGAQFLTKELFGGKFRIDIWDTAGQERFRSLIPLYMKGANIIILVLDASHNIKQHQEQLEFWNKFMEEQLSGRSSEYKKILVYNKLDLVPNFTFKDDELFDYTIGVSCRSGLNINQFIDSIEKISTSLEPNLKQYFNKTGKININKNSVKSYSDILWDYIPNSTSISKKCLI